MNEREVEGWVKEETSKLYWKFRDDLDDEGARRMNEELEYLEKILVKIINKHKTVE